LRIFLSRSSNSPRYFVDHQIQSPEPLAGVLGFLGLLVEGCLGLRF
jgi:hypothetical protein